MSALTMYRGCCEGLGAGARRIPEREDAWTEASGERGQVRIEKNAILDRRMSRQKPRGVRAQEFRSILLGEWKGVIEMETKPC